MDHEQSIFMPFETLVLTTNPIRDLCAVYVGAFYVYHVFYSKLLVNDVGLYSPYSLGLLLFYAEHFKMAKFCVDYFLLTTYMW